MAAGANPVLITRGIEKTTKSLVAELKMMSKEVIELLFKVLHQCIVVLYYLHFTSVVLSSFEILTCFQLYILCDIHDNMVSQVEDSELADVAAVSAGNNYEVGNMIAEAMSKVGRKGVVTLEEGKSAENSLYVVEGMQFDRGYISPYFVTDSEKMAVEFENCKVCIPMII